MRKQFKQPSPLMARRREREVLRALDILHDQAYKASSFRGNFQAMCGGWVNALHDEDAPIPNDHAIKGAAEVLRRHFKFS